MRGMTMAVATMSRLLLCRMRPRHHLPVGESEDATTVVVIFTLLPVRRTSTSAADGGEGAEARVATPSCWSTFPMRDPRRGERGTLETTIVGRLRERKDETDTVVVVVVALPLISMTASPGSRWWWVMTILRFEDRVKSEGDGRPVIILPRSVMQRWRRATVGLREVEIHLPLSILGTLGIRESEKEMHWITREGPLRGRENETADAITVHPTFMTMNPRPHR
mmetsp:Transcript_19162/g.40143  ORF Transcript_19162/g.40143 Transcript_19162/m.40143 type:complete len:223 (+) Transcript_19162:2597-3265(+)